jgi:hypothetical protein
MTASLQWTAERDECWGPSGEPLLSARLLGEQLTLLVRNSRHFGMEVVIGVVGDDDLHNEPDDPSFKVSFDDGALRPLHARVQDSGRLAFVADVRGLVAELNCTNRLRLHARRRGGGVWLQLDATLDDLRLEQIVEPDSGILLVYRSPQRATPAHPASHPQAPRRAPPPPEAQAPASSGAAELIGALAPLAGLVAGYKLGSRGFGPGKRD